MATFDGVDYFYMKHQVRLHSFNNCLFTFTVQQQIIAGVMDSI